MNNEKERIRVMPAGAFKARCLRLMDQVGRDRVPIVITKHGSPVAKLTPVDDRPPSLFGCLAGTVTILGDIVGPIDVAWNAMADTAEDDGSIADS
ncbi:MAG: type II toxin-antitoxin system prevent-host-death family antitoxin [Alphaproteobacteria bacterium]